MSQSSSTVEIKPFCIDVIVLGKTWLTRQIMQHDISSTFWDVFLKKYGTIAVPDIPLEQLKQMKLTIAVSSASSGIDRCFIESSYTLSIALEILPKFMFITYTFTHDVESVNMPCCSTTPTLPFTAFFNDFPFLPISGQCHLIICIYSLLNSTIEQCTLWVIIKIKNLRVVYYGIKSRRR